MQDIKALVEKESQRQKETISLIASENHCPQEIYEVMGSCLTNKYSEGYPGARYYAGNEYIDLIEQEAIDAAKKVFGVDHANVQPHSGSDANQAVYFACLQPGDTILSLALDAGGHLTHGHPITSVAQNYNVIHYSVDIDSHELDFERIAEIANEYKPKLIVCGASAYSRTIQFEEFGRIAKDCGALLLADIAHIAGLVAAGLHPSPAGIADFITTTTHKTLAGPRGGLIMCNEEWAKKIDKAVFPGMQGGPLNHVIAAKALCFQRAQTEEFKEVQKATIANAQAMQQVFIDNDFAIVAGGTDTHLLMLDLSNDEISAKEACLRLEEQGIITNFNTIPNDPGSAQNPSGLRIGTAAISSRGMQPQQAAQIAQWIIDIIISGTDHKEDIKALALQFKA